MERLAVGSAVIGLMFLISWSSAFAAGQQGFSIKVCTSPDDQFWANSVIIEGAREVMLVDAQLTKTSAEKVLQQIEETKKPSSTIYITHAHADHFLGLEVFKEAYPGVRIIATSAVVDRINIVYSVRCTLDTYTQAIMPAKRAAQDAVLSMILAEKRAANSDSSDPTSAPQD